MGGQVYSLMFSEFPHCYLPCNIYCELMLILVRVSPLQWDPVNLLKHAFLIRKENQIFMTTTHGKHNLDQQTWMAMLCAEKQHLCHTGGTLHALVNNMLLDSSIKIMKSWIHYLYERCHTKARALTVLVQLCRTTQSVASIQYF